MREKNGKGSSQEDFFTNTNNPVSPWSDHLHLHHPFNFDDYDQRYESIFSIIAQSRRPIQLIDPSPDLSYYPHRSNVFFVSLHPVRNFDQARHLRLPSSSKDKPCSDISSIDRPSIHEDQYRGTRPG